MQHTPGMLVEVAAEPGSSSSCTFGSSSSKCHAPLSSCLKVRDEQLDKKFAGICSFESSVSSTPKLPDTDCKQSDSGSDSPLRRRAVQQFGRHEC